MVILGLLLMNMLFVMIQRGGGGGGGGGAGGGRGGGGGRRGEGTTYMIFFPASESRPYWLGKKSKLFQFFDSWGRNPVFQFSLEAFEEV